MRAAFANIDTPVAAGLGRANDQVAVFMKVSWIKRDPTQPRKEFKEGKLQELQDSIREVGLLQPLVVKFIGPNEYMLVTGERRLTAIERLEWTEVLVIIRKNESDGERLRVQLIENLQRADLSPLEEAQGYKRLMDEFGIRQLDIAAYVGKSPGRVSEMLRLLEFSEEQREKIRTSEETVSASQLLEIAKAPEEQRDDLLARTISGELSVAKLRVERKQGKKPSAPAGPTTKKVVTLIVVPGARVTVAAEVGEGSTAETVLPALLNAALDRAQKLKITLPDLEAQLRALGDKTTPNE